MHSENKKAFLVLLRLGVGNQASYYCEKYDWAIIRALAEKQGLSAVILDGINCLPECDRPTKELLLQWIGGTLQGYEYRYVLYQKAIAGLASWYNSHGFKMMVLKGYACSIDWPKPEHRPCGDIDIWLYGKQIEADEALLKANTNLTNKTNPFTIDTSHHHHTVFYWQDFMVENHYDFVNVHHDKSNASIEKVFKELGQDDTYSIEVLGEKVYIPSPNLHALFLLRHSMIEFVASSITIRQLLDWAFFVKKRGKEIDWKWLEEILDEYGMKRLYDVYNAICVEDLGFESSIFPSVQFNPSIKDMVLEEILNPAIPNDKPKHIVPRVIWKYNRWRANEWKHQLVYKESMWSSFGYGVWNHLLKPSSI